MQVRCRRYLGLSTGLERTWFGETLDRFDLCVVLGDAFGCQMWIVEARSHDDSDTLDYAGFHVVDPVRLRTTIACQPDDRRRNRLNRHGGFALLQPSGIRNRRWGASSCTRLAKWCSRESHAQHLQLQECASILPLRTWRQRRWLGHVIQTGR